MDHGQRKVDDEDGAKYQSNEGWTGRYGRKEDQNMREITNYAWLRCLLTHKEVGIMPTK